MLYSNFVPFYLDDQDESKPVISDGNVPNRGHGILSRWKEEKLDMKDEAEDDSSLPDIPIYYEQLRTQKAQPGPEKHLKESSDASSTDNLLNDSDGSSSSKGSKGKAGGRGGKAKGRPSLDVTSKEASTHGIVKKGALQAALKLNQQRQANTTATERRPASTSTPKEKNPHQRSPATGGPLDDEIIIDVEMTPDELSQINKVKRAPFFRKLKMEDAIASKH